MIHFRKLHPAHLLIIGALSLSCGGEDNVSEQCWGSSCFVGIANVLPHPCERKVATACGNAAADSTCARNTMAACATEYYLRNYAPNALPDCSSSHPPIVIRDGAAKLSLSLYRYTRISDSAVVQHTQGLQRYYEEDKLTMTTDGIAQKDVIRYAISGTLAEVNQALLDAGIDPSETNPTPAQEALANKVIGDVIFKPTREFLQRHALPAEGKVNVAAIDQIVSPEMVEALGVPAGTVIVGLGLSSSLINRLAAEDPESESLNTMLDIDTDFTPTLFVGHTDIARLTGNFDLVVAHEMGHALGLPHVTDTGNLMEQGGSLKCRPWLGQDQIDIMGPLSQVVLTPDDALSVILAGRKNLLNYLRGHH